MFSEQCKLHMEEADMTRWQHFKRALWISWQLEKAAYACFFMRSRHDGLRLMHQINAKKS